MRAVILAAGRGTRMEAFTAETPKPLLLIKGKSLLERTLSSLPNAITECVIVLGYLGDAIRSRFGSEYAGLRIRYVYQEPCVYGTAGALLAAREILQNDERFLVLGSDNLYEKAELTSLLETLQGYGISKTIKESEKQESVLFTKTGRLLAIRGSIDRGYRYVGVGAYCLNLDYFKIEPARLSNRELSIPHTLTQLGTVRVRRFRHWFQINSPQELLAVTKFLT